MMGPNMKLKAVSGEHVNGCVVASSRAITLEDRLVSLESVIKGIHSDMQSVKKCVLLIEQKLEVILLWENYVNSQIDMLIRFMHISQIN